MKRHSRRGDVLMPTGFGFVSEAERRQADLFLADLLGEPVRPVRPVRHGNTLTPRFHRLRPSFSEQAEDSFAEQSDLVSLQTRGGIIGNGPDAVNEREALLHTLNRLLSLWSISMEDHAKEYRWIEALQPATRVASNYLVRTLQAIRRNQEPHLHHQVMKNFFEIDASEPVGIGQKNLTADVRKLQVVLVALKFLPESAVTEGTPNGDVIPDASMPLTLDAIRAVKERIAGARLGWAPLHLDESEAGGDRFGGRTYEWRLDPNDVFTGISIFVPRGTSAESSNVHVFFSPGEVEGESGFNAVLHHGLRAACDDTGWILIGVPGRNPGFVTIDMARIEGALRRVGRSTTINRLRLSAHSRGGRGLRETLNGRKVEAGKIDRVALLDCEWGDVTRALESAKIPRKNILSYYVTDPDVLKQKGKLKDLVELNARCARAIGYSRLIQAAMVLRPFLDVPPEVRSQLLTLPPRGQFRLKSFCGDQANKAQIDRIVNDETQVPHGLKEFLDSNQVNRLGQTKTNRLDANTYSHHFFVAEIAHEFMR